jgi:vacuolar-type H+-ATPase subunit I/STV1
MNSSPDSAATHTHNTVDATSVPPTTTAASPTDVDSIMRKMAEQQTMITHLNEQLHTKTEDVQKLSEKQRKEMKHIYDTVIAGWVDQQETVNVQTRDEFKSGIMRLADTAQEDNGIWQVVMCASSASQRDRESAAKKETEFQALNTRYQELQTRVDGGRFTQEDARVGSKRAAPEETLHAHANTSSGIWDQFGDFMKQSYTNDSFAPVSRGK